MTASIAIFHAFARSGGTLVNQLLGCSPLITVLSEVAPAAAVVSIERQLTDWHHLLKPDEVAAFADLNYLDKIAFVQERTMAAGRHLCIRDWPTPAFLARAARDNEPSLRLENILYLRRLPVSIHACAILRRSAAVHASIVRHVPGCTTLSVKEFTAAYEPYLQCLRAEGMPRFYLEDICAAPAAQINALCSSLHLPPPADITRFHDYQTCTGNNSLPRLPTSAFAPRVLPTASKPATAEPIFHVLDQIAGYEA